MLGALFQLLLAPLPQVRSGEVPCILLLLLLCTRYLKMSFSGIKIFSLPAAGFSRDLGCGACRRIACTPRCKCGSRPGSVARALGVQSREIWQVIAGLLCNQLEPTRPTQTPKMSFCSCFSPLSAAAVSEVPQKPSKSKAKQPRYNSSRTSSVSPKLQSRTVLLCMGW